MTSLEPNIGGTGINLDLLVRAVSERALRREERGPHETYIEVPPDLLATEAGLLGRIEGARLINMVALDERPRGRGFRVLLTFSLPEESLNPAEPPRTARFVSLAAQLAADEPRYPTVSVEVHAADWYERENYDLFGIVPAGHPLSSNLVLHYDWPDGLYPLRKDFPREVVWPERVRPMEPPPRATGPGIFQYTVGPVRGGITESARFIISSLGEEIADVETRLFWNHRGVEKRCEGIALDVVLLFAERVAANSAVAHSLAFAQAVESATGVEISRRAAITRVVLAEMERIYNHVNDLANQAEATGLSVGHAQGAILTEQLRRLNAEVTGHRYLFRSIALGGVYVDLHGDLIRVLRDRLAAFQQEFRRYIRALMSTTTHLDRLEETGILTNEVATDHAVVGPVARASGLDTDVRRDHPYAAYESLSFKVPIYLRGDALARNRVRIDEVFQSLEIIQQALEQVEPGELRVTMPRLEPFMEAQGIVEGPRGAIVHWIMADDNGQLYRCKIRPASFTNWHVFHLAAAGANILTDFPIIDSSFALVLASNDR